jgi:hypothetical protein
VKTVFGVGNDCLGDLSVRTDAEIRDKILTRLVQLALRWIFIDQPIDRLRAFLGLVEQVRDRSASVETLESLLRYLVPSHVTGRRARGARPVAGDIYRRADRADQHRPLHRAGPVAGSAGGPTRGRGRASAVFDRNHVRPAERGHPATDCGGGRGLRAALVQAAPERRPSGRHAALMRQHDKRLGTSTRKLLNKERYLSMTYAPTSGFVCNVRPVSRGLMAPSRR